LLYLGNDKDRAIVTMEGELELLCDLAILAHLWHCANLYLIIIIIIISHGAIFNDRKISLT